MDGIWTVSYTHLDVYKRQGIASVIAIVSVGEGTKNQMNSEIDDIGGGQIAISVSDRCV